MCVGILQRGRGCRYEAGRKGEQPEGERTGNGDGDEAWTGHRSARREMYHAGQRRPPRV